MTIYRIIMLLALALNQMPVSAQIHENKSYLIRFTDTANDQSGYKDQHGHIVIETGKYDFCFTDTFRAYAIVSFGKRGFVAIDRQENVLYKVFPFDNGPDYPYDGLFRIVENNKIGYASEATGKIVVRPQFDCAFPFEKGIARVGLNCKTQKDGEHFSWTTDKWVYIDKKGKAFRRHS